MREFDVFFLNLIFWGGEKVKVVFAAVLILSDNTVATCQELYSTGKVAVCSSRMREAEWCKIVFSESFAGTNSHRAIALLKGLLTCQKILLNLIGRVAIREISNNALKRRAYGYRRKIPEISTRSEE